MTRISRKPQTLETKRAEVSFRRLDPHRFRECQPRSETAAVPPDLLEMLHSRAAKTRVAASMLQQRSVPLSPFLEIGAERCQRALVLRNEFGCEGFAVDISLESLRAGSEVADHMGYENLPGRVCCDAHVLPIASASLSFAFCYQTLHHFANPTPVLAELRRVLHSGGAFYFDEEPGRGWARLPLFERDDRPRSNVQRFLQSLHLLEFLSRPGGPEVRHGVTEGEFSIREWERLLQPFNTDEVCVQTRFDADATLSDVLGWRGPKKWWIMAKGASVHGLCRTLDAAQRRVGASTTIAGQSPVLVCPECLAGKTAEQQLIDASGGLTCPECTRHFPTVDGVHMLFVEATGRALYPEHFQ